MLRQWGGLFKGEEGDDEPDIFTNVNTEDEYENEEQYEKEFTPNNEDFEEIDTEFKKTFLDAKHKLYMNSVLKPHEDNANAQDVNLLELYETYLKMFYQLCEDAKAGRKIPRISISLFPKSSIDSIVKGLNWITHFYSNNSPRTTIPYSHFIYHHLYTNIYDQS